MSAFAFLFLDCFIPVGVMGSVLEQIPAACRQGTPPKESAADCRAICEHLWVWCLAQGYLPAFIKVPYVSFLHKVNY